MRILLGTKARELADPDTLSKFTKVEVDEALHPTLAKFYTERGVIVFACEVTEEGFKPINRNPYMEGVNEPK